MKKINTIIKEEIIKVLNEREFSNLTKDILGEAFKPGDMWSEDFDYVGMLTAGTEATYEMGLEHLTKLYDSFTDVNYHTEAKDLGSAIEWLEDADGEEDIEKANDFLFSFRAACAKTLKNITKGK